MVRLKMVGVEDEKSCCCDWAVLTILWRWVRKQAVEIVNFRD